MKEFKIYSQSEEETEKEGINLGSIILQKNPVHLLILLMGELGAGKTTFIKGVSKGLKVKENVESPTFVFLTYHRGLINLYHVDLYRINSSEELDSIGFFEIIDKKGVTIVEWGEKLVDIIEGDLEIFIDKISENEREIHFLIKNKDYEEINEYFNT